MSIVRTTALRLALVALAALTAWTGIAREVLVGGGHALVITNQAYAGTVGRLENPHHDGRVVAAALESVGFAVTHVRDAGRAGFQAAVAQFIATLAKAGPRAVGFFYYSGHGAAVTACRAITQAGAGLQRVRTRPPATSRRRSPAGSKWAPWSVLAMSR